MTKLVVLVRCDKAARLIIHTWAFKLLNQAARPSCSTNLVGQLAVWTRLNWVTIKGTKKLRRTSFAVNSTSFIFGVDTFEPGPIVCQLLTKNYSQVFSHSGSLASELTSDSSERVSSTLFLPTTVWHFRMCLCHFSELIPFAGWTIATFLLLQKDLNFSDYNFHSSYLIKTSYLTVFLRSRFNFEYVCRSKI